MNNYVGIPRNGLVILILSIVTCGIYMIYWLYTVMDDINNASNEANRPFENIALWIVGAIFCSPITLVILYIANKNLERLAAENRTYYKDNFILWLVLTLLCGIGTFIAMFQISDALNAIWDERQGRNQPYNHN